MCLLKFDLLYSNYHLIVNLGKVWGFSRVAAKSIDFQVNPHLLYGTFELYLSQETVKHKKEWKHPLKNTLLKFVEENIEETDT